MSRRKRTVEPAEAADLSLAGKLAVLCWEALRAWDSVNGKAVAEWDELSGDEKLAFRERIEALIASPFSEFEPDNSVWEVAVRSRIVGALVNAVAF